MSDDDELVGINEIAELARVSRQAVANWRSRASDFPKPVADLASGPVFRRSQVRVWLRRRKVPMCNVVSTINLKGGVGKTTTTVALAETFSAEFRKKVLVIDISSATSASVTRKPAPRTRPRKAHPPQARLPTGQTRKGYADRARAGCVAFRRLG